MQETVDDTKSKNKLENSRTFYNIKNNRLDAATDESKAKDKQNTRKRCKVEIVDQIKRDDSCLKK